MRRRTYRDTVPSSTAASSSRRPGTSHSNCCSAASTVTAMLAVTFNYGARMAPCRFALGKALRVHRRIATVDGGRLRRDVSLAQVTVHEFPHACARRAIAAAPALPGHEDVSLAQRNV